MPWTWTQHPIFPYQMIDNRDILSTRLNLADSGIPLKSNLLEKAAGYFYRGEEADAELLAATPEDIGAEFEKTGSIGLYAFTNEREDFATLIDSYFQRKFHFSDIESTYDGLKETRSI